MKFPAVPLAVAALALVQSAVCAQPAITNIPRLFGQYYVIPTAVSADGRTVIGGTGFGLGFQWTASQSTREIGTLPGGSTSRAFAVTPDGSEIVGDANSWAFRYNQTDGIQHVFSTLRNATARGVSSDGNTIVGVSTFNSQSLAYRYSAANGLESLPAAPGGNNSTATGVSGDGSVVVGYGNVNARNLAFRWTQSGGMQMLGVLTGGQVSTALAISSDSNVIVGRSGPSGVGDRAYRWMQTTGMQSIGVLAGDTISEALAVNATGSAIVGRSTTINDADKAFLWTAAAGMVNLNTYLPTLGINLTGWNLTSAVGISADGSVITGIGTFNNQRTGWVVTVPAPGTASLLTLAGLAAARRRRT